MNDQYYKLPYAFFENEKYRGLTANEGYIYAVLYARYELSYRNNDSHDSDGTFVYYTVRGLMSYVGISSTATAVKCLKKSMFGAPIAYLIRGTVIALRKQNSSKIFVTKSEEAL